MVFGIIAVFLKMCSIFSESIDRPTQAEIVSKCLTVFIILQKYRLVKTMATETLAGCRGSGKNLNQRCPTLRSRKIYLQLQHVVNYEVVFDITCEVGCGSEI